MAMPNSQHADPETQLEVDEMILDCLLYKATEAVLAEEHNVQCATLPADEVKVTAEIPLNLVDSFLVLFKHLHPTHDASETMKFRLRLLKYAILFARRRVVAGSVARRESLKHLRDVNQDRALTWLGHANLVPDDATRDISAMSIAAVFQWNRLDSGAFYVSPEPFLPSLMDTLPSFMALCAAFGAMEDWSFDQAWMEVAVEYMLQAALEQYLVLGVDGSDAVSESFAWGFLDELDPEKVFIEDEEDSEDDQMINAMFQRAGRKKQRMWTKMKEKHLRALLLPDHRQYPLDPPEAHLRDLAARFPLLDFERKILSMLRELHAFHNRPLLVQLEAGKMDFLTRDETERLKLRAGLL